MMIETTSNGYMKAVLTMQIMACNLLYHDPIDVQWSSWKPFVCRLRELLWIWRLGIWSLIMD